MARACAGGQLGANGVHGNPIECAVQGREEPDDLDVGLLAEDVKRPSAVLAAAPGHQGFHRAHHGYGHRPRGLLSLASGGVLSANTTSQGKPVRIRRGPRHCNRERRQASHWAQTPGRACRRVIREPETCWACSDPNRLRGTSARGPGRHARHHPCVGHPSSPPKSTSGWQVQEFPTCLHVLWHSVAAAISPLLTTAMILATAAMRLVPHPGNFTPVLAIALFGGARFESRTAAFAVPVLAMFLSDLGLELMHGTGFHALMPVVYAAVVAGVVIGFPLRDRVGLGAMLAGAVGSSVFFYLSTNFAVWLAWDMYPTSVLGLLHCYAAALPLLPQHAREHARLRSRSLPGPRVDRSSTRPVHAWRLKAVPSGSDGPSRKSNS